jgi:hypothetical protein
VDATQSQPISTARSPGRGAAKLPISSQKRVDNLDELLGCPRTWIVARCLGIDDVLSYVVLDHFGDEPV